MITVGLVKELHFISSALATEVQVTIMTGLHTPITVKIDKNAMSVWYQDWHIWQEDVTGDESYFGLESCDSIARIIAAMNVNDMETAKISLTEIQGRANVTVCQKIICGKQERIL